MRKQKLWKKLWATALIVSMVLPMLSGLSVQAGEQEIAASEQTVKSTEVNYMSDAEYASLGFGNLKDIEEYVDESFNPLEGYQPMILNELYIGHLNHPDDYKGYFATAESVETASAENFNLNTMQSSTANVGGKKAYYDYSDMQTQCVNAVGLIPGNLAEDGAEVRGQILIETRLYQDTDGRDSSDFRVQAYSLVDGSWTGGTAVHRRMDTKDDWVGNITIREQGGYNAMTVGDFDGDNFNEVAVFCPYSASSSGVIYIYQPEAQADGTYSLKSDGEFWVKNLGSAFNWADGDIRPLVSMTTTDMAGRDDIVLSVTQPHDNVAEAYEDGIVAVLRCKDGNYTSIWSNSMVVENGSSRFKFQNVTPADLNGDGVEEIVIAGHKNTGYENGESRGSIDEDEMFINVLLHNGENYFLAWTGAETPTVPRHPDLYVDSTENDPISLTAGLYFKESASEVVFCEGVFLHFNKDRGASTSNEQIVNGTFTNNELENLKFSDDDEAFIGAVATGCFVDDQRTVEQTVVLHGHNALGDDTCDINITWFYAGTTEEGTGQMHQVEANNDYINDADEDDNGTCVVLAPVNVDDDSYYIKYKERYFGYSNPKVMAVLLAQPYWEEFDYGSNKGQSAYTVSYTEGSGVEKNWSAGQDFSGSISVGGDVLGSGAKAGISAEYAGQYVGSRTNMNTKTKTKTFHSYGEDMVVVSVVPIVSYHYEVINPATLETEPMILNTSYTPAFANISVDKYNKVAEKFNAGLEYEAGKLTIIDLDKAFYEGYEAGDPSTYPNSIEEISSIEGDAYRISDSVSVDMSGSGSVELGLSDSSSETESHGFAFSWGIGMTAEAAGGLDLIIFQVGATVSSSVHLTGGYGQAWSTINEEGFGYSGEIVNLPDEAQTGTDVDGNPVSNYAYSAQLVQWNQVQKTLATVESGEVIEEAIPYVGYITTTYLTPPRRVQDLEVVRTTKHAAFLEWTKPTDRRFGDELVSVDYYKLYMATSVDGEYEVVQENGEDVIIDGDATSYMVSGLYSGRTYYFKIRSYSESYDTSILSPVAVGTTKGSGVPIITKQPEDIEAEANDCPEFDVAAKTFENGNELSYQWQKLDGVIWEDIDGATAKTFNPAYDAEKNPKGMLQGYNGAAIGDPNNYLSLDKTKYRCVVTEVYADGSKETVTSNEAVLYVKETHTSRSGVNPTLVGRPNKSDGEVYQAEGATVTLQYGFEESYMCNSPLTLAIIDAETGKYVEGYPVEVTTAVSSASGMHQTSALKTGKYYAVVKYAGSDTRMPAMSEAIIIHITKGIDIYYELNGGTNSVMNPSRLSVEAESFGLLKPKKGDAAFLGWYTDEELTIPLLGADKNKIYPAEIEGDSLTVYAAWEEPYCLVNYELNGGINGENPTQIGSNESFMLKDASKTGYTFEGWYLDAEFTEPVTEVSGADKTEVTVYAKWSEALEYRIQYILGEGENAKSNPSVYTIESEAITFADATSENYTFTGWYKDAQLTEKMMGIPAGSTGDVTVYAGWEMMDLLEPNENGEYEIDSYEDLIAMAKMVKSDPDTYANATYVQTADINCKMKTWPLAIGTQEVPFNGTYEGNGHYILALRPTRTVTGLFGVIGTNGVVRDLSVVDFDYEEEARYASGFAGVNYGLIDGCGSGVNLTSAATIFREGMTEAVPITTLDSEIKATEAAGGLVIFNEGTIKNSRNNSEVTILAKEDGTIDEESLAGGIAAENTGAIQNVYQNGVITGGTIAGGIAGTNSGTIEIGYNSSTVTAQTAGAIVGTSENTEIKDFYYNSKMPNASGNQEDEVLGVSAMEAADMKTQDFADTLTALAEAGDFRGWTYDTSKNEGYPRIASDKITESILLGVNSGTIGIPNKKPAEEGDAGNKVDQKDEVVNTGDSSKVFFYGLLLFVSLSYMVVMNKKKRGE